MGRIAWGLLGLLLVAAAPAPAGAGAGAGADVASADGTVRVASRDPALPAPLLADLADRAAREYAALRRLFRSDVGPVRVVVADRPVAFHRPPATVHIPSRTLRRGTAITAHEITHLLARGWASQVLKEGLAVYAQERVGTARGWPNYRRTVHATAARLSAPAGAAVKSPADAETVLGGPARKDVAARRAAYAVAGSWVQWLIEEIFAGDTARFMDRLYRSGDYRAATGESHAGLQARWRAFIDGGRQ
ncbi:MAG: hypothetical protein H6907_10790 [Hyphomicrobiales bacterium]|nr:hypothetical protein [Hyphomicrobiales bacterium]MCP5372205.1 hypothetical protein [Hyphomicrobiales bacterium]